MGLGVGDGALEKYCKGGGKLMIKCSTSLILQQP